MADNFVSITGTTTRDLEVRYIPSGTAVGEVGIAFNERVKGDDGTWEDGPASFFDITIWGEMAENVANSIPKGTRVVVTGRLKMDSWENPEGEKRTKVKIVADSISPDLKWATAEVTKIRKGEGGGSKPAPRQAPPARAAYGDDESPFS